MKWTGSSLSAIPPVARIPHFNVNGVGLISKDLFEIVYRLYFMNPGSGTEENIMMK
jgi:hypothetical protein